MDLGWLRILESARRHGQRNGDIFRAVRSPLRVISDVPRPGTVTVVGLDTHGLPIEVMIDVAWPAGPVVFHAKRIDESRQRELLGGRQYGTYRPGTP